MPANDQTGAGESRQRLDKWLWFARIVKTREDSQSLIEAGHVRINRAKVTKPGHGVKPGDVLTIVLNARVRVLRVEAFAGEKVLIHGSVRVQPRDASARDSRHVREGAADENLPVGLERDT